MKSDNNNFDQNGIRTLKRDVGVVTGIVLGVLLLLSLFAPAVMLRVGAQRVQPGYGAEETAARMYTLQDIEDRLTTGATATQATSFNAPGTGPTVASGLPSVNDIVPLLPELDNTNCAGPDEVLSGQTFFSLCTSTWGNQIGTAIPNEIIATGQKTCYDAAGTVITCAGTGQDGEHQAGANIDTRFTDNSNGTVTDNLTGLIWLQNANCAATVGGVTKTTRLVWEDALTWSNNMASGSCGLTDGSVAGDWRLPNKNELWSLIDYQNSSPALPNDHVFTNVVLSNYWTSSTRLDDDRYGWLLVLTTGAHFIGSQDIFKSNASYVWPVR